MNKYWFVPKRYGWGFFPISWEGWLFVALLLGLVMLSAWTNNFFNEGNPLTGENLGRFILDLILLILSTIPFCEKRTKSEVKWNWGKN